MDKMMTASVGYARPHPEMAKPLNGIPAPTLAHLTDTVGGQIDEAEGKVSRMLGGLAGMGELADGDDRKSPGRPCVLHRANDNQRRMADLLRKLDQLAALLGD